MKAKLTFLFALLFSASILVGCDSIFVKYEDKFAQVELSKEQLQNDTYYIKDGTKFISTLEAQSVSVTPSDNISRRILYLGKNQKTVPTLYKGEIIAIASDENRIDKLDVVRYKEIGYSVAAYGLTKDSDGYWCGTTESNVIKNSSLFQHLETNAKSSNIQFISINGTPLNDNIMTDTGMFYGLEYEKPYEFEYYSGTAYCKGTATADIFALEEFEYYQLTDSEITKNGYIEFKMPDDAKSGWYAIDKVHLFKYINEEKGVDASQVDMNVEYYGEEILQEDIYAQKYSVVFDIRLMDVEVKLPYYNDAEVDEKTISAKMYSPDKTFYTMEVDTENNIIYCMLDEAMAGKWTIYVEPKELQLSDVKVVSSEYQQEITKEEHTIVIDEEKINALFEVSYEGNGTIYAILVSPNGETYTMDLDEKNHRLVYSLPYAEIGTYTTNIYHYTDTNVLNVSIEKNTITESEIIVISD